MQEQKDKSPEFIQQKYVQLLEKSNVELHEKTNPFSYKNALVYFSVFFTIIVLGTGYYTIRPNNDIFKDHLSTTNYNSKHVLLETKKGTYYQISENTDEKWLAHNGVFVNVNDKEITFTATKSIPEKRKTTYTLWTPKDKQYTLINTDGTKVQLNSNTQLTFTNTRLSKYPNAVLKGEALFDVAHDSKNIYTISASDLNIEVYGTEFNVSNYQNNEFTQLALINGSVKVINPKNESKYVKPGQQATLYKENHVLIIDDADFSKALAWRSDQFYFNDENLEEIAMKVALWYNTKFLYTDATIKNIHFTGTLKKENGLIHFLEMLQYTEGINYKINDKKVILFKKKNKRN